MVVLYNIGMKKKRTKEDFSAKAVEGATSQPVTLDAGKIMKEFDEIYNYQRKQRSNLLGVFSADGKYKIENETILKELLAIPKKFENKENGVVYASTKLGYFVLNFKIVFDIKEDFCKSKLYIIETEQNVDENIKHVTELDSNEDIYSPKYQDNMFALWKVYRDEEIYEKTDFLHNYLRFQEDEYLFSGELTEVLSQLYLAKMLKILDSCGELGAKVKKEYQSLVEKMILKDPSLANNATKLKMLLDEIIRKNKAFGEFSKSKEVPAILRGYCEPIKKIKDKAIPAIVEDKADKPEKKKEEAKKEEKKASKSKAKAKGGNKGGGYKPFDPKSFVGNFGSGGITMPKPAKVIEVPKPVKNVSKVQTKPIKNPQFDKKQNSEKESKNSNIDLETKKKIEEALKKSKERRRNYNNLFRGQENENVAAISGGTTLEAPNTQAKIPELTL